MNTPVSLKPVRTPVTGKRLAQFSGTESQFLQGQLAEAEILFHFIS